MSLNAFVLLVVALAAFGLEANPYKDDPQTNHVLDAELANRLCRRKQVEAEVPPMSLHFIDKLQGAPLVFEKIFVHHKENVSAPLVGNPAAEVEDVAARTHERRVGLSKEVRGRAEVASVDTPHAGHQ